MRQGKVRSGQRDREVGRERLKGRDQRHEKVRCRKPARPIDNRQIINQYRNENNRERSKRSQDGRKVRGEFLQPGKQAN